MARTTAGGGAPLAYSFRTASARRSKRASSSAAARAPPPRFSSAARVRDRSHAWSVATLTRPSPVTDRRGRASERVDEGALRVRVELPEHALDRADRLELLVAAPGPRQRPHGEAQRVFVGAAAAGDHGERPLGPRAFLLGRPRSRAKPRARVGVRRLLLRRRRRLRAPPGLSRGSVLARRPYRMPPRFMMRRSRRTMGPSSHCSG